MSELPALAVSANERHGVTLCARDLATAVEAVTGLRLRVSIEALLGDHPPERAHLHFTDRLLGPTPEAAAAVVERIAGRTALTVTLHDVPQDSDGPRNGPRRTDCYARVVAAARGVVVNSRHEAAHLSEAGIAPRVLGVVPLPVSPAPAGPRPRPGEPDVAVLGFFYPGKGHAEVADAVPPGVRMTVLGGPSDGHEGDLLAFVQRAGKRDLAVEVTGFVPDDELVGRCRSVGVPVVAHRHFSASGSLATWIAAGRRPLVVEGRYTREMAALRPGTVHLVAPDELPTAIAEALADPSSTWLAADAVTRPHLDDTAAAYVRWWREKTPW